MKTTRWTISKRPSKRWIWINDDKNAFHYRYPVKAYRVRFPDFPGKFYVYRANEIEYNVFEGNTGNLVTNICCFSLEQAVHHAWERIAKNGMKLVKKQIAKKKDEFKVFPEFNDEFECSIWKWKDTKKNGGSE
jgi:hypothetical protein